MSLCTAKVTHVFQALIRASHSTAYESIRQSTRGIAFFGTPHRGGNHADIGRVIAAIVAAITGNVKNNFMETLQKNSTIAADIHELFIQQAHDYQIVSFYEMKPFTKHIGLVGTVGSFGRHSC
jgi:protein SERAC1